MQPIRTLMLVIVLALVATACGSPVESQSATPAASSGDTIMVGYAVPELSDGQVSIMNGFVSRAEAKGWTVEIANANSDADTQSSQIERFVANGVDAIVAVPIDSTGVCPALEAARAANIKVYTIDRAPSGCTINMTVLSDNYLAGRQAGEALVALLTERYGEARGTVLELQGDLRQTVAQNRGGGFNDVLKDYPNIEIIQRETLWQANAFEEATQEILASDTVLDAIYMHSDCVGVPAVLPAIEQAGKLVPAGQEGHIFLLGVDGCASALDAIRAGSFDHASSQPLVDFGIIADWMERELNGETVQPGPVIQEGALWSPAEVRSSPEGLQLFLATTPVNSENVDLPSLWGNQ